LLLRERGEGMGGRRDWRKEGRKGRGKGREGEGK